MNTVFQLHAIHSSIRKIMITPIKMKTPKMILLTIDMGEQEQQEVTFQTIHAIYMYGNSSTVGRN